jgi:hypothetical protein
MAPLLNAIWPPNQNWRMSTTSSCMSTAERRQLDPSAMIAFDRSDGDLIGQRHFVFSQLR